MAENKTMFIGVAQIQQDWGISRSKAYQIIKDLNAELKKKNPGTAMGTSEKNKSLSGERQIRTQRHALNVSNLIIVPFRVLINQKHRRHYGK